MNIIPTVTLLLSLLAVYCNCVEQLPNGLKPAREKGQTEAPLPEPPNLRLRSRMMAAMNTETKSAEAKHSNKLVILSKGKRKPKNSASTPRPLVHVVTANPAETTKRVISSKPSAPGSYSVNSHLQTNFVDSRGNVLKNVVSIPIPVEKKKTVSSFSPVEVEDNKSNVEVRFGEN